MCCSLSSPLFFSLTENKIIMRKGSKMSAESRARISAGLRGRPVSAETRAKIGASNSGHVVSEEMRQHLSAKLKGRPSSLTEDGRRRLIENLRSRTRTQATIDKWRESRAGYRHSQATKDKIRENAFIRVFTDEEKLEYSERMQGNQQGLGYRHTDEAKAKIGEANSGELCHLKTRRGADNNFWKGGITDKNYGLRFGVKNLVEYKNWRDSVFRRDDYTCQFCHQRGGELQAHHIFSFSSIVSKYQIENTEQARNCSALWEISNGITYCEECHCMKHFGHPPKIKKKKNIIPIRSA